jgi:ABC-type transport system involved in multi-copper enzyme maturation permease subunit
MRTPLQSGFGAVFQNEVLLNSKRVAPYVLMVLFAAQAVLWWGWGPAVSLGWATNSEYYIVRNLRGFSFLLGLPIFNAVIMGDAVIRDFRLGIDPLIFSKPISRAEYLLGKFFGNFFVLACCQLVFTLTLFVLQAFRTSEMVVQPFRVVPYFKHFFLLVVISHFVLAAFYFAVGTLTRNAKIVYGLAVAFYPLYIAYQGLLKGLPEDLRVFLDPMLMNFGPSGNGFGHSADFLNQLVISYSPIMIANRALVVTCAAVCLAILYLRFAFNERSAQVENFTSLSLTPASDGIYYDAAAFEAARGANSPEVMSLPAVSRTNDGIPQSVRKLIAALEVEFRLLRAERSLIVLLPLAIVLSTLEITVFRVVPEISYSATYASNTASTLLLFIIGIIVFYTGEAMHRDRELRIEPVLWSTPVPNSVILLSKFLVTFLLSFLLIGLVGLTAMLVQAMRGHTPVEITPFVLVYGVVLLPGVFFIAGVSVFLNVLLRNKYLTYVVSIGTSAGLFYLYGIGYNHWPYNPLLYRLWAYADLNQATIFWHRLYCIAIAGACLGLAHILFERKSKSSTDAF